MTLKQIRQANEQLQNGWLLDWAYFTENGTRIAVHYTNIDYNIHEERCLRLRILYKEQGCKKYGLYLHGDIIARYKNGMETEVQTQLLDIQLTNKVYSTRKYTEICKYSNIVNKNYVRNIMRDAAPGYVEFIS